MSDYYAIKDHSESLYSIGDPTGKYLISVSYLAQGWSNGGFAAVNIINKNNSLYDPIILFLDILLNKEQYLTRTKILKDFAAQDIDTLTEVDINMILDYIKEDQNIDLTELSLHPRILAEFIRNQIEQANG